MICCNLSGVNFTREKNKYININSNVQLIAEQNDRFVNLHIWHCFAASFVTQCRFDVQINRWSHKKREITIDSLLSSSIILANEITK